MGQMIRCPLVGSPCVRPITIEETTFFLAETEKPEESRKRRNKAISEALADEYKVRSALEEKGINAFTCKICEMIQTCAYGMADISQNNANVFMELGMMLALGKPTVILAKKGQEKKLRLPSDLTGIEVIPFEEYLDIIDQLRDVVKKLPSIVPSPSPIQDLAEIQPQFARELKKMEANIVREFKRTIREAKIDTFAFSEENEDVSPEINEKIKVLEGQLENMRRLGVPMDAEASSLKGNYLHYKGNYEEALASFNWSLELRPDDPDTITNRAEIYLHLGRYKEALADCNRTLEIKPDSDEALHVRGSAYIFLGKRKKALTDLNRYLKLKPDDPDTLTTRGVTYRHLARYDKALADFNHALALRPDDPNTLYDLACLFSLLKKTDEALASLEKAISKNKKYRKEAREDEDFNNIKEDPRFKKLIEPD